MIKGTAVVFGCADRSIRHDFSLGQKSLIEGSVFFPIRIAAVVACPNIIAESSKKRCFYAQVKDSLLGQSLLSVRKLFWRKKLERE
jgi:hypothetical protein